MVSDGHRHLLLLLRWKESREGGLRRWRLLVLLPFGPKYGWFVVLNVVVVAAAVLGVFVIVFATVAVLVRVDHQEVPCRQTTFHIAACE